MLKILKASAGSGKTYNLAREYIRLIVGSDQPDAYRHVLAVTFTNKATDEMKRRILKELYTLSTSPEESPYLKDFVPSVRPNVSALQQRAAQQLSAILNDYSAFAVSTIDRFFQQTLRAFSREIGQFASYQVQVDRESLLTESVDRVLDGLSEKDAPMLDWLTRSAQESLQERGKIGLEEDLQKMAADLSKVPEGEIKYDKEAMTRLRKQCESIIKEYPEKLKAAVNAVLDALHSVGVEPEDTNRGFLKAVRKNLDSVEKPSAAFVRNAEDPELWFSKAKAYLLPSVQPVLEGPLKNYLDFFGHDYQEYNTALILKGQLYSLGVARELRDAFSEIQKEKNVLSLDDSNTILQKIIDGTDTPFIYEKMGVRYEDFLLDEFQDTSDIQWSNFRPLVHGSVDSGNDSLVVGDVKQSIYRWRGSDWNLLGSRLEQEFRQPKVEALGGNYRTCREIVNFNNGFFHYAAGQLDALLGTDRISRLYADVSQKVCFKDPAPGSVEVLFTEDQMGEILRTLDEVHDRGGQWADVAILVRGNDEGARIAAELVAHGYPVVSDDSLYVKTSVTVRRLVSQLSLVESVPREGKPDVAGYMARSLQVEIPERYHSLVELAESILRDLRKADPDKFKAEVPYIQSFMDYLQEWTATGGNKLDAFLRNWEEAKPKISSPAAGNSVRVMTIHKSKGLEFPFVIVPFAEKVTLYKAPAAWARPQVEGSALEGEADGIYRVQLDKTSADSFFREEYGKEIEMQAIDNINVFYVALTRAQYGLKVIAAPPPKTLTWKNLSHFLYDYVKTDDYQVGTPYDFHQLKREESKVKELELDYVSYPADSGSRLRFSPEAADYFGEDGLVGPEASTRIRGNVLHGILQAVTVPEDLPGAVDAAILSGDLPLSLKEDTLELLGARIASVKERGWFSPEVTVRSEAAILSSDGQEFRPDRVVLYPDGSVHVIDYKFGQQEEKYQYQVKRYVNLYRKMGYKKVEGYIWYLEDNLIIFVS